MTIDTNHIDPAAGNDNWRSGGIDDRDSDSSNGDRGGGDIIIIIIHDDNTRGNVNSSSSNDTYINIEDHVAATHFSGGALANSVGSE